MTDNEFHEQMCKHILLCKFSNEYTSLTEEKQHQSDSPIGIDLYEPTKNIGVEVTEANIDNAFNKAISFGFNAKNYEDDKYKTIISNFGGFSINKKHYDNSVESQDDFIYDRFINALENKNNKYDEHYSEFNADLFIHDLLHINLLYDIQRFIDRVLEYISAHNIKFRYVYCESFSVENTIVIQFDIKNLTYKIEYISNSEINIIAEYLSTNESKD